MKPRKTTPAAEAAHSHSQPPRMTRRQLSKHQREVRLQRIAIAGAAVVLALVLLVPIFGYWREVLAKGDQPIALVRGEAISTDLYARYLGYQQARLQLEIERVVAKVAARPTETPATPSAENGADQPTTTAGYEIALQFLQQRAGSLPSQLVDELIEGKLVRDEAKRLGLTASPAELDAALQKEMSDYSLGGFGLSEITGQPAETLTIEQARDEMNGLLAKGKFLSADEHRTLVLETAIYRAKIEGVLATGVKTSGEQVHARHILVDTEEEAKDVRARLERGDDFAAVAKELSKDTSNKDKGGDLDWFARGAMLAEFEEAAFAMKPGELSAPVRTSYGYHVIKLEERADDRPYTEEWIARERATLFSNWLAKQQSEVGVVEMLASADKLTWASNYVTAQLVPGK